MNVFIGVISNSVTECLIADIVYNKCLQKTRPNFLTHCRKLTIDVIKISFPRCFSCKKSKTADAINATPSPNPTPSPKSNPQMFLATLTLHTQGLSTACLRDILIYSFPHISLPVSHPNTVHHSRLPDRLPGS